MRTKALLTTSAAALLLISGLTGCSKKEAPTPEPEECNIDGAKAPEWVCNEGGDMEGGLVAVGSADKSMAGRSFQRTEAVAAARDALARQMSVKVKNMFKQFQAVTGVGDDQTVDKATQNVSKQLASQTLTNSKVNKKWINPKTGEMYVLVVMADPSAVKDQVKTAAKTSLKNDKALWQKFLAQKADKELEAAIDKEFGGN